MSFISLSGKKVAMRWISFSIKKVEGLFRYQRSKARCERLVLSRRMQKIRCPPVIQTLKESEFPLFEREENSVLNYCQNYQGQARVN